MLWVVLFILNNMGSFLIIYRTDNDSILTIFSKKKYKKKKKVSSFNDFSSRTYINT